MDLVRDVCSLGRFAREEANIKVRQPISSLILPKGDELIIGDLLPVIKEELNVKEVKFKEDMTEYLDYVVKPNFQVLGKTLGPKIKELQQVLAKLTSNEISKISEEGLKVKLIVPFLNDDLSNWYIRSNRRRFWDSELTESKNVQALRKEADFIITDHIKVYYNGTEKVKEMFNLYKDYIMGEVLGDELIKDISLKNKYDLNDEEAYIDVERIK